MLLLKVLVMIVCGVDVDVAVDDDDAVVVVMMKGDE